MITYDFLHTLKQDYGESFYLLNMQQFVRNYTRFLGAFSSIYPQTSLAYSYKTNYTPALCLKADELGGYAEVVSQMEYELAIHIGISPKRIIFNGPIKTSSDMQQALLAGSTVNIDAVSEIADLESIARNNPEHRLRVGIRCNFDLGAERISRFGLDVTGDEFYTSVERLRKLENIHLAGLHCHFSTPQRDTDSYALRARTMIEVSKRCFQDEPPDFIDLGGGFFGPMPPELQSQFPHAVPEYHDYANAIAPLFVEAFGTASGPELILEPGIGITGDVMSFVCRAVRLKKIRSRYFVTTTGSIYDIKPTLNDMELPMQVHHKPDTSESCDNDRSYDITGYTCMEVDILRRQFQGHIQEGDFLMFSQVGAYSNVLKPPFIRPSPAILMYDENTGETQTVRNPENIQDILSTYIL